MRTNRFKFRAWDILDKKMLTLHHLCLFPESDGRTVAVMTQNACLYPMDRVIVMQFTGLKDKNGTDIFEGDIVNCWADLEDGPYLREVVYGHESQMCGLTFEPFAGFTLCKNNEKHFEVIGNIHDNPTLLKAEV